MEINDDEETALEFFTYGMYEEEAESKIIDEESGAIDTYFSESFPLLFSSLSHILWLSVTNLNLSVQRLLLI